MLRYLLTVEYLQSMVYTIPAILLAISAHEFAHGYVSYQLGDPTPKMDGRLTLNPLAHLDPWGTVCLVLFRMGWAKPVRINTAYYKEDQEERDDSGIPGGTGDELPAGLCGNAHLRTV